MRQQSVALQDFNPADVRFGSIASDQARPWLRPMSASLRKRTKQPAPLYVRFVPEATQRNAAKAPLLDQLVRANEKGQRQFKPKRFGGLEVYTQLTFRGLLP